MDTFVAYKIIQMQYITAISAERLNWCCHQLGITTDELAAQVKLAPERLKNDALQNKGLTFKQLSKIAHFLGKGVLFFSQNGESTP